MFFSDCSPHQTALAPLVPDSNEAREEGETMMCALNECMYVWKITSGLMCAGVFDIVCLSTDVNATKSPLVPFKP